MKIRPLMQSANFVRNVKTPGRYGDGRAASGSAFWSGRPHADEAVSSRRPRDCEL